MQLIINIFLFIIRFYKKFISPFTSARCIFHPSCSSYAEDALATHGLFKASWLIIARIARCHPFNKGGYDPVPPAKKEN